MKQTAHGCRASTLSEGVGEDLPPVAAEADLARLRQALLAWYGRAQRALPWRASRQPYHIWLSEIMLQQTRVAAVLAHYREFLEAFPSIAALAAAREEAVLARWSGLGYYRRARLLHRAAQQVVEEFDGRLPSSAVELRQLAGIGRYTAAAIASIAFGEAVAVVDGNVARVVARLDGVSRAEAALWQRAEQLLDGRRPGAWNQAMMELGALICLPRHPTCVDCPLRCWCRAPGAEVGKPRVARRRQQIARAWIESRGRLYLVQRSNVASKMAGMWELPSTAAAGEPLCRLRHSITDTDYEVRLLRLPLASLTVAERRAGRWFRRDELAALPLTGLTRKALAWVGRNAAKRTIKATKPIQDRPQF